MTQQAVFEYGSQLNIDWVPSLAVAAGTVVQVRTPDAGWLWGVVNFDLEPGELGSADVQGIYKFKKEAGGGVTFEDGAVIEWDLTSGSAVASGDAPIAICERPAADDDDFVLGKLLKLAQTTLPAIVSLTKPAGEWVFTLAEELEFTQSGTSANTWGIALEGWPTPEDAQDNGSSFGTIAAPGSPLPAKVNDVPFALNHSPLLVDNLAESGFVGPTTAFYFSVDRGAFTTAAIFAYYGDPPPNGGYQYLSGFEDIHSDDGDNVKVGPGSWVLPLDADVDQAEWNPAVQGVFHGTAYLFDTDGNQITNKVSI